MAKTTLLAVVLAAAIAQAAGCDSRQDATINGCCVDTNICPTWCTQNSVSITNGYRSCDCGSCAPLVCAPCKEEWDKVLTIKCYEECPAATTAALACANAGEAISTCTRMHDAYKTCCAGECATNWGLQSYWDCLWDNAAEPHCNFGDDPELVALLIASGSPTTIQDNALYFGCAFHRIHAPLPHLRDKFSLRHANADSDIPKLPFTRAPTALTPI